MHTGYVPADRVTADTPAESGRQALVTLDAHGPLPDFDDPITALVRAKLAADPIEDLRIDLEDGYGRFAATFAFYRDGAAAATARLHGLPGPRVQRSPRRAGHRPRTRSFPTARHRLRRRRPNLVEPL